MNDILNLFKKVEELKDFFDALQNTDGFINPFNYISIYICMHVDIYMEVNLVEVLCHELVLYSWFYINDSKR